LQLQEARTGFSRVAPQLTERPRRRDAGWVLSAHLALDRVDIFEECLRLEMLGHFCSTHAPLIETVISWEAAFTAYNSTAPLERLMLPP
jgi:hypothetical protein